MGKRKAQSVSRLSKAKRQALTWNLLDGSNQDPSNHPPSQPGPSKQPAQTIRGTNPHSKVPLVEVVRDDRPIPPFHVSRWLHAKLYEACQYGIYIYQDRYSSGREDRIGTLGHFKLNFQEVELEAGGMPGSLPEQPATLMVNRSGLPCYLVFDDEEDLVPGQERTGSLLCFTAELENDLVPLESIEYLCRINKGSRLRLEVKGYDPEDQTLTVGIDLLKGSISRLVGPSNFPPSHQKAKNDRRHMHQLMAYCFGFSCPAPLDRRRLTHLDFPSLFHEVYRSHQDEVLDTKDLPVQHDDLIPTLRPYQVRAVQWMVQKEMIKSTKTDDVPHELWRKIDTVDGGSLYYNPYSAEFSLTPFYQLPSWPGGILADEMGLGKTVEMLACILNNPRPMRQLCQTESGMPVLDQHGSTSGKSVDTSLTSKDTNEPIISGGEGIISNASAKGEAASNCRNVTANKVTPSMPEPVDECKDGMTHEEAVITSSPREDKGEQTAGSEGFSISTDTPNSTVSGGCETATTKTTTSEDSAISLTAREDTEKEPTSKVKDIITGTDVVAVDVNCSKNATPRKVTLSLPQSVDDEEYGRFNSIDSTPSMDRVIQKRISEGVYVDAPSVNRPNDRGSDSSSCISSSESILEEADGSLSGLDTRCQSVGVGTENVSFDSAISSQASTPQIGSSPDYLSSSFEDSGFENDSTDVNEMRCGIKLEDESPCKSSSTPVGEHSYCAVSATQTEHNCQAISGNTATEVTEQGMKIDMETELPVSAIPPVVSVKEEPVDVDTGQSCHTSNGTVLEAPVTKKAEGNDKDIPEVCKDATGKAEAESSRIGSVLLSVNGSDPFSSAGITEPAKRSTMYSEVCVLPKVDKTVQESDKIVLSSIDHMASTSEAVVRGSSRDNSILSDQTKHSKMLTGSSDCCDASHGLCTTTARSTDVCDSGQNDKLLKNLDRPAGDCDPSHGECVIERLSGGIHDSGQNDNPSKTVEAATGDCDASEEKHKRLSEGTYTSLQNDEHSKSLEEPLGDCDPSRVELSEGPRDCDHPGQDNDHSTRPASSSADVDVYHDHDKSSRGGVGSTGASQDDSADRDRGRAGMKRNIHTRRTKKAKKKHSSQSSKSGEMVNLSCLCGDDDADERSSIKCTDCSTWQHTECVNWSRKERCGTYRCPHCQILQPPVKSAATLIVSPSSISQQWVDEINRHIRSHTLSILVYRGVKAHRFLQPSFLAEQDIVITTYNVLRSEINYVNVPNTSSTSGSRKLRHAKRYMAIPSPLPAVEWWRVCLDEAQMVECPTAKSAEMALHLSAVNRWCVTGTPIQTGLDDLYGLFLFLNEDPYRTKFWWDLALCSPFTEGDRDPMLRFLSKKLWRTAKNDVLDQIDIPSQSEEVHWLKFSPVEEHFYKRKHEGCSHDFNMAIERTNVDVAKKISDLDRHTLSRLVHPLLRLRQACCHPQAVRGEFIRIEQQTMKMEDLLQSLISKAKLECEDAQRQLVCAINGQAAMHLIEREVTEAVDKYREVLRTSDEQKGKLQVDSLQIYHAMCNLSKLLDDKHEGVAPTTRDANLQEQMQELKDKYMSKALTNLADCRENLFPTSEKIRRLRRMFPEKKPGWWLHGIAYLEEQDLGERVIEKMKDETQRLSERFYDCHGLQYVIQDEVDTLMRCFQEAKAGVEKLSSPVTAELVSQTVDCHLRPFRGEPKNEAQTILDKIDGTKLPLDSHSNPMESCLFCQVERSLQNYETKLFSIQQRDFLDSLPGDSEGHLPRLRGTWAMSELQKLLRALHGLLKIYTLDQNLLDDASQYLEMIELMKKEFKPLRAYWGALLERVAAIDELDMAKMRLRLKLPGEPYDPDSQPYIILHAEIPFQKAKLLNDRFVASSELRRKMGQLVYLQNLEKAQNSLEETNPEPCPICTRELGAQWSVLPCGHCYCCECMSVLNTGKLTKRMKCPVCREPTQMREISYVGLDKKDGVQSMAEADIKVKGGYSTKVEGIVKTLLHIKMRDPDAKSLVFSAWQDVLNIISRALQDNNLFCHNITGVGRKQFEDKMLDFKTNPDISVLLLPLNIACNGLNIIEATNVLLVEPILNPATELQAIGRVHRIGQTRHTKIHRFFVLNTIEEELHKYLKANQQSNDDMNDKSETGNLTVDQLRGMLSFQQDHAMDDEES